ncbi:MAG TPA: hypothetical protein VIP52_05070 [Candidatus Dormibacteraeota bacterium]
MTRAIRPLPEPRGGLFFAANFEGYFRTYHLAGPGGQPQLVADAGDRTIPHALTDLGLLVRHDRGGDEIWQLSLAGLDGELRQLTLDAHAIHQKRRPAPRPAPGGTGLEPGRSPPRRAGGARPDQRRADRVGHAG